MNHFHEEEGVVKYSCQQFNRPISQTPDLVSFFQYRKTLFDHKLIGEDEQGFGYGNVSIRLFSSPRFLITGSQTSGLADLTSHHLAEVLTVDISRNTLTFAGEIQASSESMTHAALYQADLGIRAIVHVHSRELWHNHIHKLPTTDTQAEYGTPEMAYEVIRLYRNQLNSRQGVIVLGGHQDGILTFGPTLDSAVQLVLGLEN